METMIRYYPFAAVAGAPVQAGIDRLFEDAVIAARASRGVIGANLYATPESYVLEVLLPGVKAEDVAITVQDTTLTVQARRSWEAPPNAEPIWRSFGTGELHQAFTLPGAVNAGAVQAALQEGILRLDLPKAEHTRLRTIKVNGLARGKASDGSAPANGAAAPADAVPPGPGKS